MFDFAELIIWEWIIWWFISALIFCLSTAWLAGQKGRDKITWGALGLLLGIFAIILLAIAPSKKAS